MDLIITKCKQNMQRVQLYYTFYSIALAESAMERVPLHSWEMEFSIQYHVTINSQLND